MKTTTIKKNTKIGIIVLSFLVFGLSSCSNDGDQGPVGPQGIEGKDGKDGKDGNINVVSSGWVTFEISKWTESWASGTTVLSAPEDIRTFFATGFDANSTYNTDGVVLLYVDDGNGVKLAPFKTDRSLGTGRAVEFRMVFNLTSSGVRSDVYPVVALTKGTWNPTDMIKDYLSKVKWKLIVIPEVVAKAQTMKQVDLNDLNAVNKLFDLKN